jgi:ABC-type uncharacterized transport system permease subunit
MAPMNEVIQTILLSKIALVINGKVIEQTCDVVASMGEILRGESTSNSLKEVDELLREYYDCLCGK